MPSISIPPIAMASVALFVGAFSFAVYLGKRRRIEIFYFALTSVLFGLYDAICAGLYASGSLEEGLFWQRLQWATLPIGGIAFLRFTHHFTGGGISRVFFVLFSITTGTLAIMGLWSDSALIWSTDYPAVKTLDLPLFGHVVYHEARPGPLMDILGALSFICFAYMGRVIYKFHKAGGRERSRPLAIAIALFGLGFVNDVLVAWGVYSSLYLLEYSYMAIVILMAYYLAAEIIQSYDAIEDRAHLREQLRQAQKMEAIGRLAGGIAHDLNNMLTPIIGYVDMANRRERTSEQLKTYMERIGEAAEHSRKLTWQLLAFGRKQLLKVKVIDINDVLEGTEEMLKRLIPEDVEVRMELTRPIGKILADETQIQQIVLNLTLNARDAMLDGGTVTIRTLDRRVEESDIPSKSSISPGDYAVIEVSDTGVGMDGETKAKVFEPFFTTKGKGSGTGLGLATVYGIARQHDGFITVESEPGRGSTFTVFLPHTGEEEGTATTPAPGPVVDESRGEKILLVEDEEVVMEMAAEALSSSGYQVLSARTADEALAHLDGGESPDLLLSDVVMPGMNGPQLYDRIVGDGHDLKVLFMSGYAGEAIAQRGVLEDDVAIIHKPFSVGDLLEAVRGTLDYSATRKG